MAALGAAVGLAYTARTYRLSREGQLTDRYTKAVEQLGSDKIEVRLGGLYALVEELFTVTRSTIYRAIARASGRAVPARASASHE